jgi:5-methylcytosine-specific restriction endonuclease McrA
MKQCGRCQEWKERDSFARNSTKPDGLQPYCRACQRAWAQSRKTLPKRAVEGKVCSGCGIWKSAAEFYKSAVTQDGLTHTCAVCQKDLQAGYRARGQIRVVDTKRCSRCGVEKLASDFIAQRNRADGLCPYCNDCYRIVRREKVIKSIDYDSLPTDKECAACRTIKPISEFTRNKGMYYGIDPYCKQCKRPIYRKWQDANREKVRAYVRAWAARNIVARKVNHQRRRARKKLAPGSFTKAEWQALCTWFYNRCLRCGGEGPLTIDHVIPISKGGPNTIDNLQPLCGPCNSSKNDNTIDYRDPGMLAAFLASIGRTAP